MLHKLKISARDFKDNPIVDKLRSKIDKKLVNDSGGNINITDKFVDLVEMESKDRDEQILYPYYKWILITYANTSISQFGIEDLLLVMDNLLKYDQLKRNRVLESGDKDINKVKTPSDLHKLLREYDDESKYLSGDKENKLIKDGQAKIFYEDSTIKVVEQLSLEACKFYGDGTDWCTKYPNQYKKYASQGPIYAILIKGNPKEKYQFHFESVQLVDVDDDLIESYILDDYDLRRVFKDTFIGTNEQAKINAMMGVFDDYDDFEIVYSYINNPSEKVKLYAVENGLSIDNVRNPSEKVQLAAIRNSEYEIRNIENPTPKVVKLYEELYV